MYMLDPDADILLGISALQFLYFCYSSRDTGGTTLPGHSEVEQALGLTQAVQKVSYDLNMIY